MSISKAEVVVRTLLLVDLVDSTRLVEKLGDSRSSEMFSRVDRIARDLLVEFKGTEIDKTDGFLILFERSLDAVLYSVAFHAALADLSQEVHAAISARAGIHLGEVVLRPNVSKDVSRGAKPVEVDGLAKHTAARIMSLAGARQTLMTRAAFDLARRAWVGAEAAAEQLQWVAHGHYAFKGMDEAVEIFEAGRVDFAPLFAPGDQEKAWRVLALDGQQDPQSPTGSPLRSTAVLPFRDMSPERDQGYFCEGIAEEITNALMHVSGLRVASRGSSFRFAEDYDAREVGRKLNVASVLEGSVRKALQRLRITAQLTSTSDGYQLWSERFDRTADDIFAIQEEISNGIVKNLEPELLGDRGPFKAHTRNVEAHDLYLKGRYYWNHRVPDAIRKSVETYKQALAIDPNYALAYCGLADCYLVPGYYGNQAPDHVMPLAREAAEKALAIDSSLAEAHTSLGMVASLYEFDWAKADRHFNTALRNNPSYVVAHMWYALFYLVPVGKLYRAVLEARIAQALDPVTSTTGTIVGACCFYAGLYRDAIEELQKVIEADPKAPLGHYYLGRACWEEGLREQGLDHMRHANEIYKLPIIDGHVGYCLARMGREAEARTLLAELERESSEKYKYSAAAARGAIHIGLGESEAALELLDRSFEERSHYLVLVKADPIYKPLHSDSRFLSLLEKLNLPAG